MSDKQPAQSANQDVPAWQPPRLVPARAVSADDSSMQVEEIRTKIYPRSVNGVFAKWRIILVLATQAVFYGLPWLQWNGRQAVLFDLAERKFYIFGIVLWPQDVFYLAIILIISAYGLFLFTALAGRLFCGYACPQTVYTEIFMWIERKIEGDRVARIRLDESPMSWRKFRVKAAKHLLWIAVAWWTGSTFIGYFSPIRELGVELLHFELSFWQWFWMIFYSFATWGNAGFMRESVCKYMCPYARFQSVMVDKDTFVVTYDRIRGEPRGRRSKKIIPSQAGLGDCVDCTICVQVCPTGIDIRDGLQYMCIGCGACIDACDQVMDKMNYPRGLIRYTSESGMLDRLDRKQARKRLFKPRIYVYIALLSIFIIGLLVSLSLRSPLRVDIVRDRGVLGREIPGGMIENIYRIQVINMSEKDQKFVLKATSKYIQQVTVLVGEEGGQQIDVPAFSNQWVPMVIRVPVQDSARGLHPLSLLIENTDKTEGTLSAQQDTTFFVPN
ncbi:MAG TPA: cytochrome c oxidase accessory protein CcoG [Advenella kashmirensis]|uniref:Cytochrome c oxidase accessory protein CcoG n=1 Tax=Advenella kashmirensis TaxID=310575 RepID=A0A356LHI5_9BURK|nr:cytochrome c oxidase accessory protein CcoG [Advenella kashmirensis]